MIPTLQAIQAGETLRRALSRPVSGDSRADFTPVIPGMADIPAAEARLEGSFRPSLGDLVSFLVNGLCLIGRHRLLEWDSRDGRIAGALEALGHDVIAAAPSAAFPAGLAGDFDRAMLISRAFGYLGDEADRLWLKDMHRALQPGGLLLFHVLDRDRAWSLVRDFLSGPSPENAGGPGAGAGIAFDPRSGRVTARIRSGEGGRAGRFPVHGRTASVRAFNLGEIRGLLAETGFRLERAYGDWQGGGIEEAGERTGRILVVASKTRRKRRSGPGREPPC